MKKDEHLARKMYDVYCVVVGGKAFNGDTLPDSDTFFSDDTKMKQRNAWIAAADCAINILSEDENGEL